MKKTSLTFIKCLSIGLVSFIGTAKAADNAILFKIHDIVPVKNENGNVVSCDLGATFYNRTGSAVSNAAINLVWEDDVVSEQIDQEEREDRENIRLSRRNISRFNTADYSDRSVSLSLKLPPIKPYQQVTLRSKVNTDRCFLLLKEMEVEVSNCGTAGNGAGAGAIGQNSACENLFRHVSTDSPEYYTEFQVITPEEQTVQELTELESKKVEIEKVYNETMDVINQLNTSMADSSDEKRK